MRVEKTSKVKPRKKTVIRILKLALVLIVVLIASAILLVPAFISSKTGGKIILARINDSVAGKADFADLSMGWFKGIKIADLSFNDDAGQIAVKVKQIATRPSYGSILTGNLSFGRTLIDKPRVEINLKDRQVTEAKSPGQEPSASGGLQPIVLPVKKIELVLNDGNVKVTDPKAGTVELSRINSKFNLRPPGQQTDFDLNMVVARVGNTAEIKVAGRVTTRQQTGWSLKGTSGDLTIEVDDLDLESLAPIFALAGIEVQAKGLVAGNVKSQIKDGRLENLTAEIKANNLDVTAAQLKGDKLQTANLDVSVKLSQAKETINIDDLRIKTDWASVTASGVVPTTFRSTGDFLGADSDYNLKGNFNCDIAAISAQMPKTLGLKEGMQITSGRLNGSVETSTKAGKRLIRADATLAGLEGAVGQKKVALSEPIVARAEISSDKAGINIDRLAVTAPFAKINCTGRTESLKYNAEADLAKLQSELGQFINIGQYQISGEVTESGLISIGEDKIAASGSGTVQNLRLSSEEGLSASEPMANIEFAVNMDRKKNLVLIESAIANASLGRFSIKDGIVPLGDEPAAPLSLEISAHNVNFEKLQPFAVMFASFPKDMQLAGIAESEMKITSENDTFHIVTEKTNIKNIEFSSPGKKPFKEPNASIVADIEFNPIEKTYSGKLDLLSDQINVHINLSNQNKKNQTSELKGNAELEYDWSAVSALAAPYLPEGLTLQGKRTDAINFTSEYPTAQADKLLPNLNAEGKVGFEQAGYMGLDFGPTDVEIQVQSGVLKVSPFTTTVNEGQFSFAGQVDFKEKPPLFRIAKPMQMVKDIKINDEIANKLLRYVNPLFANAVNVSGYANFNCEQLAIPLKAESKNDAVVIGTISMNRVRMQGSNWVGQIFTTSRGDPRGTDMTIHPTRFVLQKGFLRYDNEMQVDVGDNPVNFGGVLGLDKSLDMTVTLPYTSRGRTARVGRETSGRRITLPLKGTLDKPELDMGKLLEELLKGQLEEQLRKGLEDLFK